MLLVTSGCWAGANVGFLIAPSRLLKLLSYTVGLIVGLAAVGAWLYFCSAYTGRTYHRRRGYRRLATVVFVALVVLKVTNPLHGTYFVTTQVTEPFAHLAVQNGPLHWTAMGLSYALAFVGYFMLVELFEEVEQNTRTLVILVSITALPVVLDIVGFATPFLVDITYEPLGVAVFAVGITFVSLDRFEAAQFAAERDTPVISLDGRERVRDSNRSAKSVWPSLATARGVPFEEVLPEVAARLTEANPVVAVTWDGETRSFRITEAPYGDGPAALGRTLVFTDVTERERYRQELERQNERLETFASVVSHDLRNPLNVARGNLELVQAEMDAESESLDAIDDSLERMETLIEEILTLARTGQPVDDEERIVLSSIVADCWAMVEAPAASLQVEGDFEFRGDSDRLNRLFENLFRNAIEHGGERVEITVGPLPGQTGFYVADDGPGIPQAERESVLESGYTTRSDGTGIGLAIVAEVVDAHGWSLTVTNGEAGGARFEVTGVETVAGDPVSVAQY